MDIDNLNTNIDTKSGIEAVKKWFQKFPQPKRPDKHLIELLEINLTRNDFEFDNEYYLQIGGTAMGKFDPSYANIFMAHWEESALAQFPLKHLYYYRFLDDIWGVWTHTKDEFDLFTQALNNHCPSFKVKATINEHSQFPGCDNFQRSKISICNF